MSNQVEGQRRIGGQPRPKKFNKMYGEDFLRQVSREEDIALESPSNGRFPERKKCDPNVCITCRMEQEESQRPRPTSPAGRTKRAENNLPF